LLTVAACIRIHTAGFSASALVPQVMELAIYVPTILFVLSRAAQSVIARLQASTEGQFLVMLLVARRIGT
jgi:hypothetical protein